MSELRYILLYSVSLVSFLRLKLWLRLRLTLDLVFYPITFSILHSSIDCRTALFAMFLYDIVR